MGKINKAIWISYDLGIGGDYPGLYRWLDNHDALECGNSLAFFFYPIDSKQLKNIIDIIMDDLKETVELRSGDRLYLIRMEKNGESTRVRGNFSYGKRKSNPWEGYGDRNSTGLEEGE